MKVTTLHFMVRRHTTSSHLRFLTAIPEKNKTCFDNIFSHKQKSLIPFIFHYINFLQYNLPLQQLATQGSILHKLFILAFEFLLLTSVLIKFVSGDVPEVRDRL